MESADREPKKQKQRVDLTKERDLRFLEEQLNHKEFDYRGTKWMKINKLHSPGWWNESNNLERDEFLSNRGTSPLKRTKKASPVQITGSVFMMLTVSNLFLTLTYYFRACSYFSTDILITASPFSL